MYSKSWTQFETQSLAFAVLRKTLYPEYLVRGDHGQIKIYKPTVNTSAPILKLIVKVEASAAQENCKAELLAAQDNIPVLLIVGGTTAYGAADLVKPYL